MSLITIRTHHFATICSDFLNSNRLIYQELAKPVPSVTTGMYIFDLNLISFGGKVPFLKSLICIEGHDNGRRFLSISAILYLLLITLLTILAKAGILVFLLLIIATPILLASSIRRIHDAGFMTPLAGIQVTVYWLNVFGLTYLDHSAKWILLLLGVISTLIISTIRNIKIRHNHTYQLGYHGPANLREEHNINDLDRVEPTLTTNVFDGENTHDDESQPLDFDLHKNSSAVRFQTRKENFSDDTHSHSFKEQFTHWFEQHKNLVIAGMAVSLVIILLILFLPSASNNSSEVDTPVQNDLAKEVEKERNHKLEMPDEFWLMLDQNDAVTIGWVGDYKEDGNYWSAITGTGDKTCTDLYFILGERIRTVNVTVKANEDYYADFSPVDTQLIIKSIADKDRFKLCGYEFKLNGTRALLRKHEFYRKYILN
ncbi:MAG: hypothetical protein ACPGJI_01720 [Kangiellaceae bacterium]